MSIERAIYGSFKNGIKGQNQGFQYYTYTLGYKDVIDSFPFVDSIVVSSYRAPLTYGYYEWFTNAEHNTINCNKASAMAMEEHPQCFSYCRIMIGNQEKCIFIYAKDLGFDWTGNRPLTPYQCATICDLSDITKYPVFYCSSPVVCCDISREEFFPNDNSIVAPNLLKNECLLDSENDIQLGHKPGFTPITVNEILEFINENEERLQILKSLITALIRLKDGDPGCRIVLADSKEHNIMWIAALSYVFPTQNCLNLSYTTYGYSIADFDINGVYVAALNNISEEQGMPHTDYEFYKVVSSFAVYDFKERYYAPNIEAEDSLFMGMIENSFTVNMEKLLDSYKLYIKDFTSYTALNSEYIAGYYMYVILRTKMTLANVELQKGLEFALKYAADTEKPLIIKCFFENIDNYMQDEGAISIFFKFFRQLFDDKSMPKDVVTNKFATTIADMLTDENLNDFKKFSDMVDLAEKVCELSESELSIIIVDRLGLDRIDNIASSAQAKWKKAYLNGALCHFVNFRENAIQKGNALYNIVVKLVGGMVGIETEKERKLIDRIIAQSEKAITETEAWIAYIDAVNNALVSKNLRLLSNTVCESVAVKYISAESGVKTNIIKALTKYNLTDVYSLCIIRIISKSEKYHDVLRQYSVLINDLETDIRKYTALIKDCVSEIFEKLCKSTELSTLIIFTTYQFFKMCDEKGGINFEYEESKALIEAYFNLLAKEHENFVVSSEAIKELRYLNDEYESIGCKDRTAIVSAFLAINEMAANTNNKGKCIFNGGGVNLIDYIMLTQKRKNMFLRSTAFYCCKYWENTSMIPNCTELFVVPDRSRATEAINTLFSNILQQLIENNTKNKYRHITDLIEYSIVLNLNGFLNSALEEIPSKVKQNTVIKLLKKDLDDKINHKKVYKLVDMADEKRLIDFIEQISAKYDKSGTKTAFERIWKLWKN